MLLSAPIPLSQIDPPQWMLLGGMVLLGWVLIRGGIARKRQSIRAGREMDRVVERSRHPKVHAAPTSDAPPETRRWMIAMFDLQRELKAELDSKIAVVQVMVREADLRIEEMRRLSENVSDEGTNGSGEGSGVQRRHERFQRGHERFPRANGSGEGSGVPSEGTAGAPDSESGGACEGGSGVDGGSGRLAGSRGCGVVGGDGVVGRDVVARRSGAVGGDTQAPHPGPGFGGEEERAADEEESAG